MCLYWGSVSSNCNIAFGIEKKSTDRFLAYLLNWTVSVIFQRNSVKSTGDNLGWPF